MRGIAAILTCLFTVFAAAVWAQEGHPLSGTRHGDWGANATQRTPVTLNMHWEKGNLAGVINPGPKAINITAVTLDAPKWTVHIEADGKDASGSPVHIVADGKIENLGSYNRSLSGAWTQGSVKGNFKVTRD